VNLAGLPQNLEDYEAVIWSCGHATNTLSLEEISLLSTYLNVGGRLFISGTNIASNLAGNGFLSNYLNLQFNQQVNYPIVFGVADDPISDGDTLYLNSQPSDQDAVTPVNGGIACFKYNGVFPCGVRFEGVYKSVALTFAFEDIRWDNPNFDMPDDVVYQILDWLGVSLELEKWVWIVPPEFNLKHNYPNPFNISTKISFILPQSSNVTLKVFNVVGALVLQQDLGEFPPGETSIEWNGKDFSGKTVASGLYVYRLEAKGVTNAQKYTASGKMVMVK
jgi:hypothetical protein